MKEEMIKELENGLCAAVSQIAKKGAGITPTELDNATKAINLMEKLCELREDGEGQSFRSYGMHYDGMSNMRGRSSVTGRSVSRDGADSASRAYRDGYHDGYRDAGGNSMENGYSGHSIKDRVIASMEQMMDKTSSDYERSTLQEMIRKMQESR
ncbi:MAG: hypothetical protein IJ521_04725 [Schwartzia sp.]|nr:hypothetical protein [Schwartzia sp. (in: firmicutes)]